MPYLRYNYVGKGEHWYRVCFEQLGFPVSKNFITHGYLITIFVVVANENIFKESTKNIMGTWGTSANRVKVVTAFTKAVKAAEQANDIAYPETFKLFKFLFPQILKWIFICVNGCFLSHKSDYWKMEWKFSALRLRRSFFAGEELKSFLFSRNFKELYGTDKEYVVWGLNFFSTLYDLL